MNLNKMKEMSVMPFKLEEISVSFGTKCYESSNRPSECYIEISFPKPTYLSYIMFQNFYTYSITIRQLFGEKGAKDAKWKTVLRNYKLMKNPHFEGDAQNWHIIKNDKVRLI